MESLVSILNKLRLQLIELQNERKKALTVVDWHLALQQRDRQIEFLIGQLRRQNLLDSNVFVPDASTTPFAPDLSSTFLFKPGMQSVDRYPNASSFANEEFLPNKIEKPLRKSFLYSSAKSFSTKQESPFTMNHLSEKSRLQDSMLSNVNCGVSNVQNLLSSIQQHAEKAISSNKNALFR